MPNRESFISLSSRRRFAAISSKLKNEQKELTAQLFQLQQEITNYQEQVAFLVDQKQRLQGSAVNEVARLSCIDRNDINFSQLRRADRFALHCKSMAAQLQTSIETTGRKINQLYRRQGELQASIGCIDVKQDIIQRRLVDDRRVRKAYAETLEESEFEENYAAKRMQTANYFL